MNVGLSIQMTRSQIVSLASAAVGVLLLIHVAATVWGYAAWRGDEGKRLAAVVDEREGASTRPASRPATQPSSQPSSKPAGGKGEPKGPGKKDEKDKKPPFKPDPKIAAGRPFASVTKKTFTLKLEGVLGDVAIFTGNQVGKVGGQVGGAKVISIGADYCEIEFEGKKSVQSLFGGGPGGGAGPGGPGGPSGRPGGGPPSRGPRSARVRPSGPMQLPPDFDKMPPALRARIKERMSRMGRGR